LLFQNRGIRQTIVKNVFWLTVGQVGSRLIRAVIIIYAARVLGAAEYGLFSYILSIAALFTVFSDIGINQILTREAAQHSDRRLHYFSTSFWIKIFLFLLTAILIIFVVPSFSKIEKMANLVYFAAFIVIFDGLREFCAAFFRAKEKMELEALAIISTNAAITILGFAALYLLTTSQSLLFSYTTATALGAFVAVIALKDEFKKIISFFDKKLVKPIIGAAWPVALVGIIGALMLNTDIIMLGWWRTAEEIGFYSASQKIIQLLYAFPAILAGAIFPTLSRLVSQKDNQKVKQLMELGVIAVILIGLPMAIGGFMLSGPLIKLVYGDQYLPTVPVFQILIFTVLIIFPATLIGNSLLAYHKQKKLAVYMGIAATGNIVFNAILIPFYGIIGAAIATIATQLLSNSLSWRLMKKINNFYTFRHLKKIIICALAMGIFSLIFNKLGVSVIINIILSAGIYFSALYLIKEKLLDEIKGLVRLVRNN